MFSVVRTDGTHSYHDAVKVELIPVLLYAGQDVRNGRHEAISE
jgi:hypothetical protein